MQLASLHEDEELREAARQALRGFIDHIVIPAEKVPSGRRQFGRCRKPLPEKLARQLSQIAGADLVVVLGNESTTASVGDINEAVGIYGKNWPQGYRLGPN